MSVTDVVWHAFPSKSLRARLCRVLTAHFVVDERVIAPEAAVALAVHGGSLAGFLVVRPCGYVEWLYTMARFRRRGVATTLLRAVATRFPALTLHCEEEHVDAAALYARAGFTLTGGVAQMVREAGLPPARMLEMRCVL